MVKLYGPNWPSKQLLEAYLQDVPGELRVCWGIDNIQGALNNARRLNGLEQLKAFRDKEIKCPDFTESLHTARDWVIARELVFGRKRFHTKGRDIVGPTHRRWSKSEYWVKVIDQIAQEWRIHSFQGRSIARGLKVQTDVPWRIMPVRNRNNGWTMVHNVDPPKGLRTLAKKATEAVGYDFGAVDLLVQEDGTQWVLEVNKAPGLDNYTAEAYARAIIEAA